MAKLSLRNLYIYRFLEIGNDCGSDCRHETHCIRVMGGGALTLEHMIVPKLYLEPSAAMITTSLFAEDHDDRVLATSCCSIIGFVASGCSTGCGPQTVWVNDECGDYGPADVGQTAFSPSCECDPMC